MNMLTNFSVVIILIYMVLYTLNLHNVIFIYFILLFTLL